jgi:hypothetical protein
MKSRFVKALSMLAAIFTLVAVSATPASADTGYYWTENRAGGCLDFSGHYGFRVFPCNGDHRYQYIWYQRVFPSRPDVYQIKGNPASGASDVCIRANNGGISSVACGYYNSQFFVIRYAANGQPYFDSVTYPGMCLTKSSAPYFGGNYLTLEPCAGRSSQYWRFSQ